MHIFSHNSPEPDWVHGHPHEPNPAPTTDDPTLHLVSSQTVGQRILLEQLQSLPYTQALDCYIISTGHGTSGPFQFGGVRLITLLEHFLSSDELWTYVDVHSADGFGARLTRDELMNEEPLRASLLAYQLDGQQLTRARGLVRLIVPSEVGDALRQVKWVEKIHVMYGP